MSIISDAMGRWEGILSSLGIDRQFLTAKPGPCVFCGGKDRFRWDDKGGKGTYFCQQCGAGDGMKLLMEYNGWSFHQAAKEIEAVIGHVEWVKPKKEYDPKVKLKKMASMAEKAKGTSVEKYLKGRGLNNIPSELRYHPSLSYYNNGHCGYYEAMLGIVSDIDNRGVTYHVTYLKDNKKANVSAPKKIMKPIGTISGCSVRLFGEGDRICVTEGIETGVAVHQITGLPVWVALNASGMESLKIPAGIKGVYIYADNDKNFTGQKAAYILANRLSISGVIDVEVFINDNAGEDWLDVLNGE